MSQLRLNPLTSRWVTVSIERSARPDDFARDRMTIERGPTRPCPFCPGHEEETPPALETYGPAGAWSVRVVPNRFPAFSGSEPMRVEHLGPLFTQAPASGIHEVLVFSPDHESSWADLSDIQAGLVMAALRDRMEDHASTTGVRYTQAIVNHGREAGASLQHPHGQLMGMPFVPGELVEEIAGFRRFSGQCLLCATVEAERDAGHRVLIDREGVMVVLPFWSGAPFELLVLPTRHQGHLANSAPSDLVAVGRALRDSLVMLRDLLGEVSYNLVVHTLPHRSTDPYHWHVHVTPRVQSIGGFEQGTGVPINIVAPERATTLLLGR
ncbi:MAG: galactose-phosphate uridylyltransferase [Acidimicrobiales bacterium]|nr:galactose-phosphate uridylyltransferase [Acidimicrobiales bacterium]